MKKKLLIMFSCLLMLTGCNNFKGTWCRSTEVFGTIIITKKDTTTKQLAAIEEAIKNYGKYKSYDVIDSIEKGNTSITIYFKESSDADIMATTLSKLSGIDKIEKKSFIVTSEKLEVKGKNKYTYSTNLDNVDALVENGTYSLDEDNKLSIEGDRNFFLKDKFVCTDEECTNILTKKSKTNTCK
ncbi:MAG: hypothetical protein PUD34_03410 [bacterium]|nr:hypothetical protein [bacterium]